MPTGQLWSPDSIGGYMASDRLSQELRTAVQPGTRYRQLCDIKDPEGQGMHKGATFHWNVYLDVATAGGAVAETTSTPETNFTIVQGSLTITEYINSVLLN